MENSQTLKITSSHIGSESLLQGLHELDHVPPTLWPPGPQNMALCGERVFTEVDQLK